MSLNAVAHDLVFANRRKTNESFDSGGWLTVFEFATALRCFAKRYASLRCIFLS